MTEYFDKRPSEFSAILGLSGDKVPDAKTIWLYREMLKKQRKIKGIV